jgi:hypothetical protein
MPHNRLMPQAMDGLNRLITKIINNGLDMDIHHHRDGQHRDILMVRTI